MILNSWMNSSKTSVLTHISLKDNNIKNKSFKHLFELPSSEYRDKNLKLIELDLENNAISSKGFDFFI